MSFLCPVKQIEGPNFLAKRKTLSAEVSKLVFASPVEHFQNRQFFSNYPENFRHGCENCIFVSVETLIEFIILEQNLKNIPLQAKTFGGSVKTAFYVSKGKVSAVFSEIIQFFRFFFNFEWKYTDCWRKTFGSVDASQPQDHKLDIENSGSRTTLKFFQKFY